MADTLTVEGIVAPLISLGAIITISLVVWNASRRTTTIEVNQTNDRKDFLDFKAVMSEMKNQLLKEHKDDVQKIAIDVEKAKADRKQEIADASLVLQKQIDAVKADVKEQAGRVTQNDTKIKTIEDQIKELKQTDKDNFTFHERWIQRVEDRVEKLGNNFVTMFSAFHGNKRKNDN